MKQKPQQKMLSPMLFVKMSYLGKHTHTRIDSIAKKRKEK